MLIRNAESEQGVATLRRHLDSSANKEVLRRSLQEVSVRLLEFEAKYQLSSELMRRQVLEGTLREDESICTWLMLMNRKARLAKKLG